MDVTAVVLHYKRPLSNLRTIVDNLFVKPHEGLHEVVIFNNDPDVKLGHRYRGATVINAGRNFNIPIRHALALVLGSTHYLFIDNDISISPGTLGVFKEWAGKHPEAILGLFGVRLNRNSDKPYTGGKHLNNKTRPRGSAEVDIVVGRVHFCRADKLSQAFWWRDRVPGLVDKHWFADDVILSLANRLEGHRNFLIPLGNGVEFQDFPEGEHSLHKMGPHWGLRNSVVLDMLRADRERNAETGG